MKAYPIRPLHISKCFVIIILSFYFKKIICFCLLMHYKNKLTGSLDVKPLEDDAGLIGLALLHGDDPRAVFDGSRVARKLSAVVTRQTTHSFTCNLVKC